MPFENRALKPAATSPLAAHRARRFARLNRYRVELANSVSARQTAGRPTHINRDEKRAAFGARPDVAAVEAQRTPNDRRAIPEVKRASTTICARHARIANLN